MTRIIPAAALAALALAATNVSAQLVYEPFEYGSAAVGQPFANQTGTPAWSGYVIPSSGQTWFTSATTVVGSTNSGDDKIIAGSLAPTYTGLAPSVGDNAGSIVSDEHVANMAITPTSFSGAGTSVYTSVVFTINDISNVASTNATGAFVYAFSTTAFAGTQGATPTIVSGLQVRRDQTDSSKFNVGLRENNGSPNITWDTTDKFTPGTPVFLVFGYTFHSDSFSDPADTQQMWVNPAASSFGAATAPTTPYTFTGSGGLNNAIKSIFINRGANNAASPNAMQFDEIRADNSWAQVTPPTGSTLTLASSSDWSNPGTWDAGGVPSGASKFAYFTGAAGGTVNVNSAQTVGTLTFKGPGSYTVSSNNGSGITLSSGSATTLSAINVQAPMDAAGPDLPVATAHAISVPITLANKLEVNVAASQILTMSGNISDATGTASLTKNGPGTLILSGINSYGGLTNLTSGVLAINGDAALGAVPASPTLNVILTKGTGSAGILRFDADATLNPNRTIELLQNGGGGPTINTNGHNVTVAGQLTGGAGGVNLNKIGNGTLTLTGDNSQILLTSGGAINSIQISAGTLAVTQDAALGKLTTGNVNLGGGTFQFGAQFNPTGRPFVLSTGGGAIDTNGFNATIDGVVSGTANLTKTGAGTLTLTGSNTLTAATRVTGGTLVLTQPGWAAVLTNSGGNGVVNAGKLVFDYTGTGTPASTVVPFLKSSHDSANFTDITQRLRTSNANDVNHGLGYYDDGVSKLSVVYTWYGDANLDGTVNGDDYALLDRAVAQGASPSWVTGDFNYDGVVNSADFLAIDTSFGKITGVLAPSFLSEREAEFGAAYVTTLIAAVPEPTSLAAFGFAAAALLRRRRNAN